MAVDDMGIFAGKAEFTEQFAAVRSGFQTGVVGIFGFVPGGFVRNQQPLKGCDAQTTEQRGIFSSL